MAKSKSNTRAKTKATKTKPETKYQDATLIRLCITIKAELAALHGCSDADPDGNSAHVELIWGRHTRRANRAIEEAGGMKATTWAGLVAKAAALPAILDDDAGGMEERSEAFYRSFAADVHRVLSEEIEFERQGETARREIEAEVAARYASAKKVEAHS